MSFFDLFFSGFRWWRRLRGGSWKRLMAIGIPGAPEAWLHEPYVLNSEKVVATEDY